MRLWNHGIYIALFLALISPCIFKYEIWPLARYNLYSGLTPTNSFYFFGFFATFEDGREIFLNETDGLYPLFTFYLQNNFGGKVFYGAKNQDLAPDNKMNIRKLKTLLRIFNFNQNRLNRPLAKKMSIQLLNWDRGLDLERIAEARKIKPLMEATLE